MIRTSELILNADNSIFHLHLQPEQLADQVILVGDPGRVEVVSSMFDHVECKVSNREFVSVTGVYRGKRITVLSTGIGTDNIDIVMNELDALANIDLHRREIKTEKRSLNLVRIGTSGGLQSDLPVNTYVVSEKAIGFDGLLNFYARRNVVCDLPFEQAFVKAVNWSEQMAAPYVVDASKNLSAKFLGETFRRGVTISAPGFYGPQGRELRLALADPHLNEKIEQFQHGRHKITNYEMECSAIYGLSALLKHEALTICLIIANRVTMQANENYHPFMEKLIGTVLDKLTE